MSGWLFTIDNFSCSMIENGFKKTIASFFDYVKLKKSFFLKK